MNFLEIINDGKRIVYYENSHCENLDIFDNPVEYIETYFHCGSKMALLFTRGTSLLGDVDRCRHMCSLYSFGAYLLKKTKIDEVILSKYEQLIPKTLRENSNNSFLYYWFMVSLFHDIAYGVCETPRFKYNLFDHSNSLRKFIDDILHNSIPINSMFEIQRLFLDYSKRRCKPTLHNKRFGLVFGSPPISYDSFQKLRYIRRFYPNRYYDRSTYIKYFKHDNLRIVSNECHSHTNEFFEHGILGGKLLYNNFLLAFSESTMNIRAVTVDFIIDNYGLTWFPEQLDIVRDLGYIIATHNLWKDNFTRYNINVPFRKIGKENPVLFLLCLCDTIDPFKFLMKKTSNLDEIKKVLEGVNVSITQQYIRIDSPKIIKLGIKSEWFDKLMDNLVSFLEIQVSKNDESIVIHI